MSEVKVDTISERTAAGGVTIDGVLVKDGDATLGSANITTLKDASAANPSTPAEINSGRAKAWIMMNGTGTINIDASFNIASITDSGVGKYIITMATDFGSVDYCWAGMAQQDGSDDRAIIVSQEEDSAPAAGSLAIITQNDGGSAVDSAGIGVVMFGDQ